MKSEYLRLGMMGKKRENSAEIEVVRPSGLIIGAFGICVASVFVSQKPPGQHSRGVSPDHCVESA